MWKSSIVFGIALVFLAVMVPTHASELSGEISGSTVTPLPPPTPPPPPPSPTPGGGGGGSSSGGGSSGGGGGGDAQGADVNDDGKIDVLDFTALMVHWGATDVGNIADFNDDGVVGILDFTLLMIHWTG